MAHITILRKVRGEESLDEQEIIQALEKSLKDRVQKVKLKKKAETVNLSCTVKTFLTNPLLRFKGVVNIEVKGERAKIEIDGPMKTTAWFWFEIVFFALCGFFLLIVTAWRFGKQKKELQDLMEQAMDRTKNALSY
jgi:hypothetical protein